MSVDCTGGKTTLVKWADVYGLAQRLDAVAATVSGGALPALSESSRLFQAPSLVRRVAHYSWHYNSVTVTDPCDYTQITGQDLVFDSAHASLSIAEEYALGLGRLHFIGANPGDAVGLTKGGNANAPCFCCIHARIERSGSGDLQLVAASRHSDCMTSLQFTRPCLGFTDPLHHEQGRTGLLNTEYLQRPSTILLPGGRTPSAEVGGYIFVSKPLCVGSTQEVVYAYHWEPTRSRYALARITIPLEGYLGWNISAVEFNLIVDRIKLVLSSGCGAKVSTFKVSGSATAYVKEYCAVSWGTLLWNVPNTEPGCISSAGLPWVTDTCGGATDCSGKAVYCNTLKHLDALIEKCKDISPKTSESCLACCDYPPVPTLQAAMAYATDTRYFLWTDTVGGKDYYYTHLQSVNTQTQRSSGSACGGGSTSHVATTSTVEHYTINSETGTKTGVQTSTTNSSSSCSVPGEASESAKYSYTSTTHHSDFSSSVCPTGYVTSVWTQNLHDGCHSLADYPCGIYRGSISLKNTCQGSVSGSFTMQDAVAAASVPPAGGDFIDYGEVDYPGAFSARAGTVYNAFTGLEIRVTVSRGCYRWKLPDTRGYSAWGFSWKIRVKDVVTELHLTHVGPATQSAVYELPMLTEEFRCDGPYGVMVFCGPVVKTAPTEIHSPTAVVSKVGAPFSHTVGANNLPTNFTAAGLPAGLTFNNTTGEISGTPTTIGSSTVTVTAYNSEGSTSSSFVLVTLAEQTAPVITSNPSDIRVLEGTTAQFTATASGEDLVYQWYAGISAIAGETSPMLVLTGVTIGMTGLAYSVVISNSAGSVSSTAATLYVDKLPAVAGLADRTVLVGATVTFAANVLEGDGVLTYQWFKNGVEIPGQTSSTYTIAGVNYNPDPALSDEGEYHVAVTNEYGTVFSETGARLYIASMPVISTQPVGGSFLVGDAHTMTVIASGVPALTYQWRKDGVDIAGATGSFLAFTHLALTDTGRYEVQVTTLAGSVLSTDVLLVVQESPVITGQPTNTSVFPGDAASFSVSAHGTPDPDYQWYKGATMLYNGGAYSGAQSPHLVISPATDTEEGSYHCAVSNYLGSVTSSSAMLTVTDAPIFTSQPGDATLSFGTNLTLSTTLTGSLPITYQWYKDAVAITGATASSYNITAASYLDRGNYQCRATNSTGVGDTNGALIDVLDPEITVQPIDVVAIEGNYAALFVIVAATAPFTYRWFKGGVDTDVTTQAIEFSNVSLANVGTYYCVVEGPGGLVTSDPATISVHTPPEITLDPAGALVAPGGSHTLTAEATGVPAPTYQWFKDNVPISGATSASYTLTSVTHASAGDYFVRATNSIGTPGYADSAVAVISVGFAPVISAEDPTSKILIPGETVTFSFTVSADPSAGLTYQWYKNGSVISGATDATFTITSATEADQATYTCEVTNIYGTTTSADMVLTIYDAPVITDDPVSVSVALLASAAFSVTAVGMPTLTYQWYKGGSAISGATAATLSFAAVVFGDAGSYFCRVTNGFGTADSSAATLSVHDVIPIWTTDNDSASATEGLAFSYEPAGYAINYPTSFSLPFGDVLPAGLGFSTTNGSIVGTLEGYTHGNYVIRILATNSAGDSTSVFTLYLTVNAVRPEWSLPSDTETGYEGIAFTYDLAAIATHWATGFSINSGTMPPGLDLNTITGEISGTPTAGSHGVSAVTFLASNSAGASLAAFSLTFDIHAVIPLWANSSDTAYGTQGAAFSYDLGTQVINTPTLYEIVSGTLPDSLGLDSGSGVISGTLSGTSAGYHTLTFRASNSEGASSTNFTLNISVGAVVPTWDLTSDTLNADQAGPADYDFSVHASNFPTSYAISGGLPTGLSFDTGSGVLSGTLDAAVALGTYYFTLTATNTAGASASFSFALAISAVLPVWNTPNKTVAAVEGTAFVYDVASRADNFPTAFSVTSGALPSGLSFDTGSGQVTGTPAGYSHGSYSVTVRASNTAGNSLSDFTLTINVDAARPAWSMTEDSVEFVQGFYSVYEAYPYITLFPTSYDFSGTLPVGLSFDYENGVVYGTATTVGVYVITIAASNSAGTNVTGFELTINVVATRPGWDFSSTYSAVTVNTSPEFDIGYNASNYPTSFALENGTLPTGLSLDTATGVVSGTIDSCAEGSYSVEISATNSGGKSLTNFTLSLLVYAVVPDWSTYSDSAAGFEGVPFPSYDVAPFATNCATSFGLSGGSTLPSGLSFGTDGVLSGTPAVGSAGSYTLYAQAINGAGGSLTSFMLSITIT